VPTKWRTGLQVECKSELHIINVTIESNAENKPASKSCWCSQGRIYA